MANGVAFPIGEAKLDLRQPIFDENRKSWDHMLQKYNEALDYVSGEGDAAPQELHQSRGQLLGTASVPPYHV